MRGTRRTQRNLEVPLERDELVEIGKEAGQMEYEIIVLEAEKKRQADIFKGEIEDKAGKVRELLSVLRQGSRTQTVDVEIRYHEPSKGKRTIVRLDTGECYAVEDMTPQELADDQAGPGLPYGAKAVEELKAILQKGVDDETYPELERWAKSVYPREEEREIVVLWASGLKQKEVAKVLAKAEDAFAVYKLAMAMPIPSAALLDMSPRERLASLFELGTPTDDEIGVVLNAWGMTDAEDMATVTDFLKGCEDPVDVLRAKLAPAEGAEELPVASLLAYVAAETGIVEDNDGDTGKDSEVEDPEEPEEPLAD